MTNEIICTMCGCTLEEDEAYYTANNGALCEDCFSDNTFMCEHCSDVYLIENNYGYSNIHEVQHIAWRGNRTECWCEDCADSYAYICECCEERYDADSIEEDSEGNIICTNCFEEHYTRCADCGCIINLDDAYYSEARGDYYCESCYEDNDSTELEGYHHEDYSTGFDVGTTVSTRGSVRVFGIELEVADGDSIDECVRGIKGLDSGIEGYDCDDLITFKADCTVTDDNNGFEMAMRPMTMEAVKAFNWEGIRDECREHEYLSHDAKCSCGLHVHVNKSSIKNFEETVSKETILIDRFWDKIKAFSRRNSFTWCDRPMKDTVPTKADSPTQAYEKLDKSNSHHTALNIRYQQPTIELRVFKGTLNPDTIKACVQFHDVLITVAEEHDFIEIFDTLTWDVFKETASRKGYTEMVNYMNRRGI